MLDGIKRLFSSGTSEPAQDGWEGIAPWAESKQYTFRGVQSEGFVVDGRLDATPWRLEWGPSQRPYIAGQELRIRSELGLPGDLHVVLMNVQLQEAMENAVFEQYVEGVQTRIDNQTPPEMRWLVMYPKLASTEMPTLGERFVALSSMKGWLLQWLEGPLTQSLAGLRLEPTTPLVLMIGRGRLMLRTALADSQVGPVQNWLRVFETAMREALRVGHDTSDATSPTDPQSSWPTSALPGADRDREPGDNST